MVSVMNGPIPPHPYYDKDQSEIIVRPAPRVRPEAEQYAQKGQGSVGNLLVIEGQAVSSAGHSRKINVSGPECTEMGRTTPAITWSDPTKTDRSEPDPKDHVKENVRRMRQIQRETRRREADSSKPVKAMWKSSKFENVSSRVKEDLQKQEAGSRPQSANYLRAHSRTGYAAPPARPASAGPPPVERLKLTVPKAETARDVKINHKEIDFIKLNGRSVKSTGMRRSPSLTALDDLKKKKEEDIKNYRKGTVPDYLVSRQKKWAKDEEKRIASIPDPDLPPGHKIMPKEQQQDTLKKLKMSQEELVSEMSKLPIRTDTHRMRTKKDELDRKLAEVEEAIKIFSRPKVFVKLDT